MLEHHPSTQEVRELLAPVRQLMERCLYTGVTLEPEAVIVLLNVCIVIDDKMAQFGDEAVRKYRALAQMEAVARDLDVAGQRGAPPRPEAGGQAPAVVLPFKPRPAPRPLYEPAGPGGAA